MVGQRMFKVDEDRLRFYLIGTMKYEALHRNPSYLYTKGEAESFKRYVEDYNQLHYSDFQTLPEIAHSLLKNFEEVE